MDLILQDTLCEGRSKVTTERFRAPSNNKSVLLSGVDIKKAHTSGGLVYINTLQRDFDFILQKHKRKENIAHEF